VAAWLVASGHRPSILSRGYARAHNPDGVVVVSDGVRIMAGLDDTGDEPLMLARAVAGAVVCVSPDRHLAGVLAERHLGATAHILDDGFQHLELARDLDILVTTAGEIPGGQVLPRGRLREPMDAAAAAHVLVVMGATAEVAAAEAWTLGIGQHCASRRVLGEPRAIAAPEARQDDAATGEAQPHPPHMLGGPRRSLASVIAVAGIGNPGRFFEDLRNAGWRVVQDLTFADHHRYTNADVARIAAVLRETGADAVLTTEKDAVRFEPLGTLPFPIDSVPLTLEFDPPRTLFEAIEAVLERERAQHQSPEPRAQSAARAARGGARA
jgi:tetraacyldisaccharide 4'-kinase